MLELCKITIEAKPSFLSSDKFQDSTGFREWLLQDQDASSEESVHEFESFRLVYAITQEMSQLRYHAEEYFKTHNYLAQSKRKELPVTIEEILEKITSDERDKEPPETVISRIAQYDIALIELTLSNVRKILRRERKMTGISSVQQLDSQCLIWLTRQPGITPAQKAGARQKIMAVVRQESFNTLENRVLKAFLQLCVSFSKRYLKEYKIKFQSSERIRAVQHLLNTAKRALSFEIMSEIANLSEIPVPNYVLLHDQHYSRIWLMYLALLHQTALLESAWKNRVQLIQQFVFFRMVLSIHFLEIKPLFHTSFWFSSDIKKDGLFIKNSSFRQWIEIGDDVFQFSLGQEDAPLETPLLYGAQILSQNRNHRQYASVIYLPKNLEVQEINFIPPPNHFFFIFSESEKQLPSCEKHLVLLHSIDDIENAVMAWVNKNLRPENGN